MSRGDRTFSVDVSIIRREIVKDVTTECAKVDVRLIYWL
jgi:hypothetical protein